jgi:hypothetical protein
VLVFFSAFIPRAAPPYSTPSRRCALRRKELLDLSSRAKRGICSFSPRPLRLGGETV